MIVNVQYAYNTDTKQFEYPSETTADAFVVAASASGDDELDSIAASGGVWMFGESRNSMRFFNFGKESREDLANLALRGAAETEKAQAFKHGYALGADHEHERQES